MLKYKTQVGVIKEGPLTGELCIFIPLIPENNGIEMNGSEYKICAIEGHPEPMAYYAENVAVTGVYPLSLLDHIEILGEL